MSESFSLSDLEIQDRAALKRVPSLSTELEEITEVEYRKLRIERVVLAGVWTEGTWEQAERSLEELARLAETAGSVVLAGLIQRRDVPDTATYIGSGKALELKQIVKDNKADTVIFDGELSPGQLRHLEDIVKVKVIDRTWLILDIFAQHAKSSEGKAQVALAQMQYMLPRLRGWGEALSRQAASGGSVGIGTRGPGETKIETDRRRIRDSMARLRREIKQMAKTRDLQRKVRRKSNTPAIAITGYTNAGKSSLLNRITKAEVLVEDALFATLDTTVRKAQAPSGREVTISDTVGFVRHLPHGLVEAFRSTLEEVTNADLILHVVDASDPDPQGQYLAVREVLAEIDANNILEILVFNKIDLLTQDELNDLELEFPNAIFISAQKRIGIDELWQRLEKSLPEPTIEFAGLIPYSRGDLLAKIHNEGKLLNLENLEGGMQVKALVAENLAYQLNLAKL
ncbi:MAG: GTPase HflX [Candidatus Nanopelagicales bacterium]